MRGSSPRMTIGFAGRSMDNLFAPRSRPLIGSWIRNAVFMKIAHSSSPGLTRRSIAQQSSSPDDGCAGQARARRSDMPGDPWTTSSLRGLHDGGGLRQIDDAQRGADALGGAVLEADHGIDRDLAIAAIDRIDDVAIFLVDHAAADLARPSQLAIVGIKLLVEQEEAGDALRR